MSEKYSDTMTYKVTVVLLFPFCVLALLVGAICGVTVTGFLGGYYFVTKD